MIFPQALTEEQRRTSQINYNRYCLVNGASYACLGETVVILFAIKLQAPNFVIAAVGAMLYFGFLLLPLGIIRMGQVGAARSQADFWVCRNIAALLAASSAFLLPFSRHLAWGTLLLGCFLFYGFRAAGVVMAQPLIGDITTEQDRARLLGESSARFYIFGMLSLAAISLLLGYSDNIRVLTGIIVAGACLGITSSTFIRKIDETAAISESAKTPLVPQLRDALHDPLLRRQIYAGFMLNLANIMLAPISVTALKRGYDVSDKQAILFSLVQFTAAILGSKLTAPVTAKVGPRKLAACAYLLTFPVCLFWIAVSPVTAPILFWSLFSFPFLLTGIYIVLYNNAMIHYFLLTVPARRQVVSSMFINVASGVAASVTGMVIAGLLLKWTEVYFGPGITMFKAYFAIAGILFLAGIFPVLRLDTIRSGT